MTPQPPTQEQFELLEQLHRDRYPRLTLAEDNALSAMLAYARLGVVAAEVMHTRSPNLQRYEFIRAAYMRLLAPVAQEAERCQSCGRERQLSSGHRVTTGCPEGWHYRG